MPTLSSSTVKNIIVGAVALIILVFLLNLFLCNKAAPSFSDDKKRADSLQNELVKANKEFKEREEHRQGFLDTLSEENAKLARQKYLTDLELTKARRDVAAAVAAVKISQAKKDTVRILADCFELVNKVIEQDAVIDTLTEQVRRSDELRAQQVATLDSMHKDALRMYNEAFDHSQNLFQNYNTLLQSYNKEVKKGKRNKRVLKYSIALNALLGAGLYFSTK